VLEKIHNRLQKNGILFTGHAEANSILNQYFTGIGPLGAFSFSKRKIIADQTSRNFEETSHLNNRASESNPLKIEKEEALSSVGHQERHHADLYIQELASKIEKVANSGDLDEASRLCQVILSDSLDPEVYYVCGLVMEAKGEPHSAEALFRMVLRWDSEHYNTLTHLAANLQARGKNAEATKIRKRITHQLKDNVDEPG